MSYSFTVQASSKADALVQAIGELDKVVASQPVHAADAEQAKAAIGSFVDVLADPAETQLVVLGVSGSLGWAGTLGADDQRITSASVNVSASLRDK